jgi:DNA N-6-adenine-methyltransferase (Dam)
MQRSVGGHHSHKAGKSEWLTPPEIIAALGPFELDPCAPLDRPWPTAATHYTICDDGLKQPWRGFCFVNPPYGSTTRIWLDKLASHPGGGIALVFARTETEAFVSQVWERASSLLFLFGRLHFHHVGGVSVFVRDPDRNVIELRGPDQPEIEGVTRYVP